MPKKLILFLLPFWFWANTPAQACSCLGYDSDQEAAQKSLQDSALVFRGRLTSGSKKPAEFDAEYSAVFEVFEVYKGTAGSSVTIRTGYSSSLCGLGSTFEKQAGEEFIVFAGRQEGQLHVSLCSFTQPVRNASKEVLEVLEQK